MMQGSCDRVHTTTTNIHCSSRRPDVRAKPEHVRKGDGGAPTVERGQDLQLGIYSTRTSAASKRVMASPSAPQVQHPATSVITHSGSAARRDSVAPHACPASAIHSALDRLSSGLPPVTVVH